MATDNTDNIVTLSDDNFKDVIAESNIPVLIDFWAAWCGPCRIVSPVIEGLADDYGESVKVCKLNVDENRQIAEQYGIMSIPTVMIFKGGTAQESIIGARQAQYYKSVIDKYL